MAKMNIFEGHSGTHFQIYWAGVRVRRGKLASPTLFVRTHPAPKITEDANDVASRRSLGTGMLRHMGLEFFTESSLGLTEICDPYSGGPLGAR